MGALRPVYVEMFILRNSIEETILNRRAEWVQHAPAADETDYYLHSQRVLYY